MQVHAAALKETLRLLASGPHVANYSNPLPDSPCPHCRAGEKRVSYGSARTTERRMLHNPPGTIFGTVICQDPRT